MVLEVDRIGPRQKNIRTNYKKRLKGFTSENKLKKTQAHVYVKYLPPDV